MHTEMMQVIKKMNTSEDVQDLRCDELEATNVPCCALTVPMFLKFVAVSDVYIW